MNNLTNIIAKAIDQIANDFKKFEGLGELLEKHTKWENECAYLLSTHGWYIHAGMQVNSLFKIFHLLNN